MFLSLSSIATSFTYNLIILFFIWCITPILIDNVFNIVKFQCVILYSKPIRHGIFFTSLLRLGNMLFSRSISFNNSNNYVKLLLVHQFFAFKLKNFKVFDNRVKLSHPRYNYSPESDFKESYK